MSHASSEHVPQFLGLIVWSVKFLAWASLLHTAVSWCVCQCSSAECFCLKKKKGTGWLCCFPWKGSLIAWYRDRQPQLQLIWTQTPQEARQRKHMFLTHTHTDVGGKQAGCQHAVISWPLTTQTQSDTEFLFRSAFSRPPDSDLYRHADKSICRTTVINSGCSLWRQEKICQWSYFGFFSPFHTLLIKNR